MWLYHVPIFQAKIKKDSLTDMLQYHRASKLTAWNGWIPSSEKVKAAYMKVMSETKSKQTGSEEFQFSLLLLKHCYMLKQ